VPRRPAPTPPTDGFWFNIAQIEFAINQEESPPKTLNGHHLYAAWLLEAPCGVTYSARNGGRERYPGKGTWSAPRGKYAEHPILASATVSRITSLDIPILRINHILAFSVTGRFRFDYSAVASNASFNNKHTSGFHVIRIGMWKCNGRWGVEPSYWLVQFG